MAIPEHKGILVYILIANLINSIIDEIIGLIVQNGGDRKAAAIASVVMFVLVTVVIFGGLFVINLIYILDKEEEKKKKIMKILLLTGQAVGALCYFYGDNITQIFDNYGPELNCGQDCISNNNIAGTISSGVALLLFIEYPTCMHKIAKLYDYKESSTGWFSASGMIAQFIRLDALFNTVVLATADIDNFCNDVDIAINASFLIVCILAGSVLMIVNSIYAANLLKKSEHKDYTWISYLTLGLLLFCLPLFLLSDNSQPLDCAFQCDSFATNMTLQTAACDQQSSSAVRLALSIIILAIVGPLSLLLFGCRHNTRREGVV